MSENTVNKRLCGEIGTIAAFLVLFGLMVIFVPSVQADSPTVTITDYKVSPIRDDAGQPWYDHDNRKEHSIHGIGE